MKKPTADERRAVVTELFKVDQALAPLKDLEKRGAELRATIRTWHDTLDPAKTITEAGVGCMATVGAMENQRSIRSMPQVFASLGATRFLTNCGFTLKKLAELVTPSEMSMLVDEQRTGARPVKTFAVKTAK